MIIHTVPNSPTQSTVYYVLLFFIVFYRFLLLLHSNSPRSTVSNCFPGFPGPSWAPWAPQGSVLRRFEKVRESWRRLEEIREGMNKYEKCWNKYVSEHLINFNVVEEMWSTRCTQTTTSANGVCLPSTDGARS